ncbi:MAG: hypothetical protein DLM68_01860 [Hyphomicrobiales bacterium]|nr:MAG: hypothetical protein DLM68_01860 [Hyphomicrobiales bacterium]
MSKATNKSAAFLQALTVQPEDKPATVTASAAPAPKTPRAASRDGLKHIGGYFDRADVEKFAVLRARLGLDNSELIRLAVDELYRKHEAKRAFGD